MRIKVHKTFSYQASARKVKKIYPGEYEVGKDISLRVAESVLTFGRAEVLREVEKVAPENKVVETPENKAEVAKKPVRRRGPRAKPKK